LWVKGRAREAATHSVLRHERRMNVLLGLSGFCWHLERSVLPCAKDVDLFGLANELLRKDLHLIETGT